MSAIKMSEKMGKFAALHEFAMVNDEVHDLVKEADTVEALTKLLENFGFIPCTTKEELGRDCWDQFLAVHGLATKNMPSDFRMFESFINFSAYGEACYNEMKEEHEFVYWASTGVIYDLD